jgi:hypothetical protein
VQAKTKARTKSPLLEAAQPEPLAALENEEARIRRIMEAMYGKNPSHETRDAYRELLRRVPDIALKLGTLPSMARSTALERYKSFPALQENIRFQLKQLRKDLAGEHASPREMLLVEAVVLTYQDYFSFAVMMNQHMSGETTLDSIDKWERILSSKEARYLRAVGELAKVRRLLNLPASQINIAVAGGQQVNVQGKVE